MEEIEYLRGPIRRLIRLARGGPRGYLCRMNPAAAPAPADPAAARAARPIGLFDSGIGGLTVARAVARRLPHERLVYFGDTAHLPYGDKSRTAAIQAYSVKICDLLLQTAVQGHPDCLQLGLGCRLRAGA